MILKLFLFAFLTHLFLHLGLAPITFAAPSEVSAKMCALSKLGWNLVDQKPRRAKPAHLPDGTCDFDSARDANAKGLLYVTPEEIKDPAALESILRGGGSLCGFKMKYKKLLNLAVLNLKIAVLLKKQLFSFQGNLPGEHISGPQNCALPASGWKKATDPSQQHPQALPSENLSQAIQSIYDGTSVTDCWTGLQITAFAAVSELFGPKAEQYLPKGSLKLIGPEDSQGNLWFPPRPGGVKAANETLNANFDAAKTLGANALVGMMGALTARDPGKVPWWGTADTTENMIVTSVPPDATHKIARSHGADITDLNRTNSAATELYVHPLTTEKNIGQMMARQKKLVSGKTPFDFLPYSLNVNTTVFNGYVDMLIDECKAGK